MGGRLREFANKLTVITKDPFVLDSIQGHVLKFSQEPPLAKPTHKCEVKILKT